MRLSQTDQQFNKNNVSFSGNKTLYVPKKVFSSVENMDSVKQRLALGAAALAFQPAIDYFNPMVDEKTRKFSVLKTVVKAVVGTASGLAIRGAIIKYTAKKMENPQKFLSIIKDSKLKESVAEILKDEEKKKKFRENLGTAFGLLGVAVGDFTFDMPMARYSIHHVAEALGMSDAEKKEAK